MKLSNFKLSLIAIPEQGILESPTPETITAPQVAIVTPQIAIVTPQIAIKIDNLSPRSGPIGFSPIPMLEYVQPSRECAGIFHMMALPRESNPDMIYPLESKESKNDNSPRIAVLLIVALLLALVILIEM